MFIPTQEKQDYIRIIQQHLLEKPALLAKFESSCGELLRQANNARKYNVTSFSSKAFAIEQSAIEGVLKQLVKSKPELAATITPKEDAAKIVTMFTDLADPAKESINTEATSAPPEEPRRSSPRINVNTQTTRL